MKVSLNALYMREKAEAHAYLKEKMGFPDYYGYNLDALYDCLTEIGELEVVFENLGEAEGYFWKVYRVFAEAAEENPGLQVR